ncbi:MAG: tetratricopeptide repeat-containing sensor histidine kinase [Bacteroidota bacterium]|nr:tetratricopeptide repeat-containing sensor histidine kinase [Bacteroidota bacterium]
MIPGWLEPAIINPIATKSSFSLEKQHELGIEALLVAAEAAITISRFDLARSIATKIAEHEQRYTFPYCCYVLSLSARLHLHAGHSENGIRGFREAIECASSGLERALFHYQWATALECIGNYSDALEHYRHALTLLHPSDHLGIALVRSSIARIQCQLEDVTSAEDTLQLANDYYNSSFGLATIYLAKATAALQAGSTERVIEYLNLAASLFSSEQESLLKVIHDLILCKTYLNQARWDDAGSLAEAIITITEYHELPYHAALARHTYGLVFVDDRSPYYSPPLALEHFQRSLRHLDHLPYCTFKQSLYRTLAETYAKIGHRDKAYTYLERYCSFITHAYSHRTFHHLKRIELEVATHNLRLEVERERNHSQQLQMQLECAHSTAEKYRQRLDEQIAYLGVVAHDLKNPIAAIMMSASILERYNHKLSRDDFEKHISTIIRTAEWMKQLVTGLLDFTALTTGKLKLNIEPVYAQMSLDAVIEAYKVKALAKSLTIHRDYPTEPLYVLADRQRLQECLDNLISNAIKYTPLGRNIYCSIEEQDECVRFAIRDEGPGLTIEEQQKLFQEFSRARSRDTGSEGGTGLGLSIVRRFVEAMGGSVGCNSILGHGSTFFVELPRVTRHSIEEDSNNCTHTVQMPTQTESSVQVINK